MSQIDYDAIYAEGRRAVSDGKYPDDCPYPEGSAEAGEWLMGWQHQDEGFTDEDNCAGYAAHNS